MSWPAHAHSAAVRIDVPAAAAFAALADPVRVGRWALGSAGMEATASPGVWRGRSLFDGAEAFVEIAAHPGLGLIDYHVGGPERRSPRIFIRVAPGPVAGLAEESCLVSMTAWRCAGMSEERWARLCTTHELEVLLLKAQTEAARGSGG
ncbi:MAG: hypothetical protein KJZ85_18605 [Rhodobacteraceae bacterium]|jgi:hypothetical protein|nr:hypothetical protein [Paracoccaceae bacterium]